MIVKKKGKGMLLAVFLFLIMVFAFNLVGCEAEEAEIDEEEPLIIGVLGSLEYPTPRSALRSVELAAEEINEAGGVKVGEIYRPLEVVSTDTRDLEPGIPLHDALAAVERMIDDEDPDALLVGPTRSEVLFAAMDIIADYEIPHLITIPFDMEFEKRIQEDYETYKYSFRLGSNAMNIAEINATSGIFVMDALGFDKKAHIVYQDTMALKAAAEGVAAMYEHAGIEVVGLDPYPVGASDFSASISSAEREGASVIHSIADFPEMGLLVRQSLDMEFPGLIVGYVTPAGFEEAWDVYDGQIEGMVQCNLQMGNIPVEAHPKSVEFYENFGELHGEEARRQIAMHGPAPSYDAVYVFADAIERAGTAEGDDLIEAIKETDMMGAIGRIRFNEQHQVIYGDDFEEEAIGVIFQWQDPGVRVPVYPVDIAEGELKLPAHMQD